MHRLGYPYASAAMLTTFPAASPAAHGGTTVQPFWIDLLEPSEAEIARVNATWQLRVPSRAQLQEIESSSRLRSEADVLYLSMPLCLRPPTDDNTPVPIGFVLSSAIIVTVRFASLHSFDHVRARMERNGDIKGSAAVFAALIEEMVDVGADTLEMLAADLMAISREAFNRSAKRGRRSTRVNRLLRETLITLGSNGETLSQIRESLTGLQRIVDFTGETARDWLPKDIQVRLKTVRKDLSSLTDFEAHLSSKVQFLLDAVLGFINTEQNDMFKVLTIVSVVGVPPTLIASMYGMNFHNMPELGWRWGYAYGLTLIALSTLVPIVWFKRRGWW